MNVLSSGRITAGIIQGVILVILLLGKEINRLPNRLMAAFVLLISLHLALVLVEKDNQYFRYPHLSRVAWLFPTLYGPVLLLFVSSISEAGFRFRRGHLALLVPFLIALAWLGPWYLKDGTEKQAYLGGSHLVMNGEQGMVTEAANLLYLGFTVAAVLVFYQGRRRLSGYYSNPSRVNPEWLERFLLVLLGVITLSVASFYSKAYGLSNFPEVYPYHLVVVVILVYWIGFRLLQDMTVFTTGEPEDGQEPWDAEDAEDAESAENEMAQDMPGPALSDEYAAGLEERRLLASALERYMEDHKPYLNPNLTLNDLSSELQVTRKALSRTISLEFNRDFFTFVNEYRVREFRREVALGLNRHLSLLGIALNCGFSSARTFRKTFRRYQGLTPAGYIRESGSADIGIKKPLD